MTGSLFEGLFQIAYVTADLDRAITEMRTRFGVAAMQVTRGIAHTPATRIDVALAWVGDWMIELPTDGRLLRQHHLGHRLPNAAAWDAFRERLARSGEVPFVERDTGAFRYVFIDRRPLLGCFTEHMVCTAEGLAMLDRVPHG